jgi:hypothetical protein
MHGHGRSAPWALGAEQPLVQQEQEGEVAATAPVNAAEFREQQPFLAADGVTVDAPATPELLLADLVECPGQVALDVEASNTMSACGASAVTASM